MRSPECRSFPCKEDSELRPWDFKASLPIWGGYEHVVRSLDVVCKLFPYRDTWVENTQKFVRPSVFNRQVHMYPSVKFTCTHLSGSHILTCRVHTWPLVEFLQRSPSSSHANHALGLRVSHLLGPKCVAFDRSSGKLTSVWGKCGTYTIGA